MKKTIVVTLMIWSIGFSSCAFLEKTGPRLEPTLTTEPVCIIYVKPIEGLPFQWVCKRYSKPEQMREILSAISDSREIEKNSTQLNEKLCIIEFARNVSNRIKITEIPLYLGSNEVIWRDDYLGKFFRSEELAQILCSGECENWFGEPILEPDS